MPTEDYSEALRVFILNASLRKESLNARLADLAERLVTDSGALVDRAPLRDFPLPLYDGDVEAVDGIPKSALDLSGRIVDAQALVIVTPEYNASIPGVLKNAIDWASRVRPQPFKDTPALLLSASPSPMGGHRCLLALHAPLERLGALVYPETFSLAAAHQAFTPDGDLTDRHLQKRLTETLRAFLASSIPTHREHF
ncbi:NAD(P)H-dependent oxidoreductase [Streptomyces sp. NPDC048191]|uniref:NADPH-dependent FMN reductase n=1 Tax=Streptomyces sp. NPDC048191 TaxID=3155484 RepID=UPI0033D01723